VYDTSVAPTMKLDGLKKSALKKPGIKSERKIFAPLRSSTIRLVKKTSVYTFI
jgi:hypothetical protein